MILLKLLIFLEPVLLFTEATTCATGFVNVLDRCYYFASDIDQALNWEGSRLKCQEIGNETATDLTTFTDCHDFFYVLQFLRGNPKYNVLPSYSFWIGGTDRGNEGIWSWLNGEQIEQGPPLWGSVMGVAEPSGGSTQNCVLMYRDDRYYLHDSSCDQLAYPLCEGEAIDQ